MIEVLCTRHALSRMFGRGIELSEVEAATRSGTAEHRRGLSKRCAAPDVALCFLVLNEDSTILLLWRI